jgi:hypothetical protein
MHHDSAWASKWASSHTICYIHVINLKTFQTQKCMLNYLFMIIKTMDIFENIYQHQKTI